MRISLLCLLVTLCVSLLAQDAKEGMFFSIEPGKKAAKELQKALLMVQPGGTVELAEGRFEITRRLSLDVANVTIRGKGMDKTILSFRGQKIGAEGLMVTQGGFVLEDLAIEDTKGDGVKVKNGDGVFFRRVRVEWTNGPEEKNGAYGIYPVECKNVLVEDCVAIAASDAGIYVGQSQNIIVRRNHTRLNVAGIEIENSINADVYENKTTENSGGILVFELPNLPVYGGSGIRIFDNEVFDNNHANFAPAGNIVALVPPGTGIMVMATDKVEIFGNDIRNHQTLNMMVVSYMSTGKKYEDPNYDPYPESIFIHDNKFTGGGDDPQGELGKPLGFLFKRAPDILWDGYVDDDKKVEGKLPAELRLYLKDNGTATFAKVYTGSILPSISSDSTPYQGELPALPPVKISGIED